MRLNIKMSAVASAVAVTALSIQSLAPATAADPVPTATATPPPAAPAADEPEDIPSPPADDTEGLIDVSIGDKTVPVPLPVEDFSLPLDILRWNLSKSGEQSAPGDLYDGSAVGLYIDANVADLVKITSRKVAAVYMPKGSRGGGDYRESARFSIDGFFFSPGLEAYGFETKVQSSGLYGGLTRPDAVSTVRVAELELGTFLAEGIDVTARAQQRYPDNIFEATANVHVARLKVGKKEYQDYDVPPNTTYSVAGLGKIVLNEQKITELPGDRYAAKVNAIRITLSTSLPGLPIGTNIYIGSAEAIVNL